MLMGRDRIPPSCRDLDRDRVIKVLVASRFVITEAAEKLGLPSQDLRQLVSALPELSIAALEEEHRRTVRAEQAVLDALESPEGVGRCGARR
jgi:hypothetical protein